MNTFIELIRRLKQNPHVLALIEYGSAHYTDDFKTGDYDLFVIVEGLSTEIESLHFHVNGIPVDLNVRDIDTLSKQESLTGFEAALLDGRTIFDRHGEIGPLLESIKREVQKPYTHHDVAFCRHGHRHVLDKVQGRLESDPVLCKLLLNANIGWLIQSYFGIRGLPYRGEKDALNYLKSREPAIIDAIGRFYAAPFSEQVEITIQLSELMLRPVGGVWQNGEILAFGETAGENLQTEGKKLFERLFT
ncbi:MAG: hypothetical protein AAF702_18140 [Chloroflexota bacterium]